MPRKADIKTCRYKGCKHDSNQIDISSEPFEVEGNCYYHADCFATMKADEEKDNKIKKDFQLIKHLWLSCINNTVIYSQLFQVLNQYVYERGVDSEYLVFVVQYCIDHKKNLRYPYGLKYFIDNEEIKKAYKKKISAENRVNLYSFKVERSDDNAPKFSVPTKQTGFGSILGGKK